MRSFFNSIWKYWVIVVVTFTFSCLVGQYFAADLWWVFYFLSYGMPVAMVMCWSLLLLYFVFRTRFKWVIIANLFAMYGMNSNWTIPSSASEASGEFSLMSFNVRAFDLYNWVNGNTWDKWKARTDGYAVRDSIYSCVKQSDPDILCFQEFYSESQGHYKTEKHFEKGAYPYKHIARTVGGRRQYSGMATFSKYPIIKAYHKFFGAFKPQNGIVVTDLKLNKDTLRVINVHLESFRLSKEDYRYLRALNEDIFAVFNLNENIALKERVMVAAEGRMEQLRFLEDVLDSCKHRVLVCGDFNDVPNTFLYNNLSARLQDAFLEVGSGFGATHNSGIPALRIDYTFRSAGIQSVKQDVIRKDLSDHFPLYYEFNLVNKE